WLHTYNHHRGHTALAGKPPASRVPNLTGQNSYSNAFALSAAFKRVRGVSPQEHRRLAATGSQPQAAGFSGPAETVILAG
ncbi:hypothetical protein ACWDD9_43675, partial [Kitasatospora sp. NPDC001119]